MDGGILPRARERINRKFVSIIALQHARPPDVIHGVRQGWRKSSIRLAHRTHRAAIEQRYSDPVIGQRRPVIAFDAAVGSGGDDERQIPHPYTGFTQRRKQRGVKRAVRV